ncbi:MAG TPA: hypothetical protein VK603_10010 [Candidatus Saccharimonadales bacterium]|nr:hypothetical protein [Candidatus Saccharimonadales bacterium]
MATGLDHVLYIGTANGLYQAESEGNGHEVRLLGLQGKGALRSTVVIDREDPRCLYAGTSKGGVYRSEDRGGSWREINYGIIYKEIFSLAQHPTTGELYAGTGPSAVFKSADRGDSWSDCEQLRNLPETIDWTFPRPPHVSHIKGLALRSDNPRAILGAVEEGWVIRSQDGGETWQNIKEGVEFDAHYVAVMPDNQDVVIASSGKGVYRSVDGGTSFVNWGNGLDCTYMAQLAVHPARPKVLLTAAAAVPPPFWRRPEGAQSAFYRSENQGESWERLSGGLPSHFKAAPRAVASDPAEPNSFFVGMTDGSVWWSSDGGDSFRQILSDLPEVTSIRVGQR